MHDMPRRRAARTLALLFVMFFPGLAGAADAAANLPSLRREQVLVWDIVRDFHLQTLTNGDPERTRVLQGNIAVADKLDDALQAGTGNAAFDAAAGDARQAWSAFRKTALANNVAADGYTDDNLVGELYEKADALADALGKAIAAVPATGNPRAAQDRVHKANMLLQRTVAGYLKRAAQFSTEIGVEDNFDIGQATAELDRQIAALDGAVAGDKEAARVLREARMKWNFIKDSLSNYNEKTVPFVIDRYTRQISGSLTRITQQLESGGN